jgi:hypothetical protein
MTPVSIDSSTQSYPLPSSSETPAAAGSVSSGEQPATANASQDTVKISVEAQAKLLEQQGESVAQIATSLGINTQSVESYLGITESSAALTASAQVLKA